MIRKKIIFFVAFLLIVTILLTLSLSSCTKNTESSVTIGSGADYNPVINPADFTTKIDNKYFPLIPGTTFVYEGISEKGQEHNEMVVTRMRLKQSLG